MVDLIIVSTGLRANPDPKVLDFANGVRKLGLYPHSFSSFSRCGHRIHEQIPAPPRRLNPLASVGVDREINPNELIVRVDPEVGAATAAVTDRAWREK